MRKSLYLKSAPYYDIVVDSRVIARSAKFISKLLSKFNVYSVLELGCGTGLYLIPLKKDGFDVEGLDLSQSMLKEARQKSKTIKLYKKDMSNFKINKKYDAIICLNSSLLALPNFQPIKKTIKNISKHLKENGIMILCLPNHSKEIKESHNERSEETHKITGGILKSICFSHKKGNKWIEEWYGTVKKSNKVYKFKDIFEEFIFSPKELENFLKRTGFKILKIYGSRTGENFNNKSSYRRVYLCKKHN